MSFNPNSTGNKSALTGTTSGTFSQFASASTTSYSVFWPATQAAGASYALLNDGFGNLSWGAVPSAANTHPQTIYVSKLGGNDTTGNGTFFKPFASVTKANAAAIALTPSLTNIITIMIDPGFYSEAPGFTFVDFCNYVMPGGADVGGIYTSDSSAINVTPGPGSQIQIVNINVGAIDIAGDGNVPFNYNDTSSPATFQAIAFYGAGITGTATFTAAGSAVTEVSFFNGSFIFDPSNIGLVINNVNVIFYQQSVIASPVAVNQTGTVNPSFLQCFGALVSGGVPITATSSGSQGASVTLFNTRFGGGSTVTLNGANTSLVTDADSAPAPGNIINTGGSVTYKTRGSSLKNDSAVSGTTVTDALNNLAPTIANAHSSAIYVSKNGNDSSGNGTYQQPFLTVGRANTAALALVPTASNIITIILDAGFYAEQPNFTFLDFCSYYCNTVYGAGVYIPGYYFAVSAANATAGATYTDGTNTFTVVNTISGALNLQTTGPSAPVASSGTLTLVTGTGDSTIAYSSFNSNLPIVMNVVNGSRIFLNGIVTATSTATVAGSDVIYNDVNTGGEVITWNNCEIVGSITVIGQGGSTSFVLNSGTSIFGGSFVSVTNATIDVNQSGIFQDIFINQTNSAVNAQITFLASSVFTPTAVTLSSVGGSGNATLFLDSSGGFFAAVNLTDTFSSIQVDADTYQTIQFSTINLSGGASASQITRTTNSNAIGNASAVPGALVTDALNNVLPLAGGNQTSAIVSLAQLRTSQAGTTTTTPGSNAGTGSVSNLQGGSTDLAGNVSVTTGTGATAGQLVTVTYSTDLTNASWVVVTSTDPNSPLLQVWVTNSATGFEINTVGIPSASTTYSFNYHVIGF